MTTKNIEIQFEINGLQKTEEGINKITGSLTGLENLSKNTDTAGLTKLNKSIKDLTTGLAGMTGNLQSVTGLLTGLSANLTTASDRVAIALEKMSASAVSSTRNIKAGAQASAKGITDSAEQAVKGLEKLDKAAATGTKVKRVKVSIDAGGADPESGLRKVIEWRTHDMDKLRTFNPKGYVRRLYSARADRMARDEKGERLYSDQELQLAYGTKATRKVGNIRTFEREVASVSSSVQGAKNLEAALKREEQLRESAQVKALKDDLAGYSNMQRLQSQAWAAALRADQAGYQEMDRLRQQHLRNEARDAERRTVYRQTVQNNTALMTARDAERRRKESDRYSLDAANAEMRNQRLRERSPAGWLNRLRDARTDYQSGLMPDRAHSQKYGSSLTNLVKDAGAYEQALAKARLAVDAAADAHLRLGKTGHDLFRGLTSGIGMIWLSWGQILPMLGGFAASAGVRAMLQIGTQFEHQMKIIQVLSQETSGTLRGAQQQILEMSTSSLFGLNEMVGGLKALTQAGFTTQDAMKNLKTVMNLSMLGEVSPDQSALFLAGLRTTFKDDPTIKNGKGEVDLAQASNITAIAAARSQTSIQEMMESMKQASTVADEYHLRLTDVSVGLQLLAERNITGSAAGTSLRNAMEDLTGRTEKARKALALLKVSMYDDKTGAARNPFDVMNDIRNKMADFSESKRKRFLQEFTDERGKKLLEAFLAKSDAEIRQMQAVTFRAGENGGFVSKGADDINTSLQSLSGQTLNTFRKTAVEVFDEVNPGLKELMKGSKEMAGSSELKTTLSVISQGLLGLAKAITFTVSAVTNLTPALLGMAGGFAAFKLLQAAPAIVSAVSTAVTGLISVARGGSAVGLLPAALTSLLTSAGLVTGALMAVGGAMAYVWANTETAEQRFAAAKSRLEQLSGSLATIRSDSYAKFNDQNDGSLGQSIDDAMNKRMDKIRSSQSAMQNLAAIQDEFTNRSNTLKQNASEHDVEREMFLTERKKSFLRQQLDEFDQFLRTKGVKEDEYQRERQKFVDAAKNAETDLFNYEIKLSQLRIEQTRKEVEERSKEYLGLGKLLLSKSDKKAIQTPQEWITSGDAKASLSAFDQKASSLSADSLAGADISRPVAALRAQLLLDLRKAEQAKQAFHEEWSLANDDNPNRTSRTFSRSQDMEQAAAGRKQAEDTIKFIKQRLDGTLGTGFRFHSTATLKAQQDAADFNRLQPATTKPNGPDKNISDLGHQRREPEGPIGPLMSLIDKITGEDSGSTKLKNILGLTNDKDGLNSKAINTVFESLKAQGSGAGFDLVKNFKTSDDLRKYLKDFVDENMTFEGKLKAGYRKMTDDLEAQVKALQDDSQAGDSESFVRMLRFRASELKKHDDYYNAQIKDAKGNQGLIDKIEAERQRTRGDFEKRAYSASVADMRKFGDDELRRAKNDADKEAAAQMADIAERTKELNRQFSGFGQWAEDSAHSLQDLSLNLDSVNAYLKKFTLAGLPKDAWSAGKSTVSSFFETDNATRNLRLAPTLGRLQDKLDTKLGNNEVEARRLFNPDQYDKGTTEYDAANEAYNKYLTQRNNAARDAYDREVQFAKDSFDKQQSFAGQTQMALTKFWSESATPAEIYGKTLETGLGKLTQAFIDAGHGAELSFWMIKKGFKDLVKDMLIQMAVTQMMKATTSAISTGIGLIGGAIGAYFGGASAGTTTAGTTTTAPGYTEGTLGSGLKIPTAHAAGGRVSAGQPTYVGEQGWEVFVPQTDGYIVPNQIARNATKGADSYNVAITINDNSVSQQTQEQGAGGKQNSAADLGAQIKAKVMEVLVEQKRAGGVLSR